MFLSVTVSLYFFLFDSFEFFLCELDADSECFCSWRYFCPSNLSFFIEPHITHFVGGQRIQVEAL